jgi:cytochrome oxidase Cu insertion factor (SCO1/SenC/PrrC family)
MMTTCLTLRVTAALASMGLAFTLAALPASADWQGLSQKTQTAPSNPAWEEYAFDLPYADDSGRLTFEELAKSGQPFILVWWLTDCPLCNLELPYVEQLKKQSDEYGLGVRVISICVDDDKDTCLDYMQEKGMTFEVLFDQHARRTDDSYSVSDLGTPLTYVFDSNGEFVDYLTGFRSEYAKSIYKMLGITPPQTSREGS